MSQSDTDATVADVKTKGDYVERQSTQKMALGHGPVPPTKRGAVTQQR